ncbi:hypothetical protein LCGC14_2023620 [marine sediment metagenome]|uniref:Uncharacterized protein n=1 Tax=marine sediment metagenome TaxID=412755 RepID=A0A0F9EWY4_9ZZZZ
MKLMLETAMKAHPEFANFDTTKNVQDQLQEMVLKRYNERVIAISMPEQNQMVWSTESTFHHWKQDNWQYTTQFVSMEQLWLSYVMWEKYQKKWNGSSWCGDVTFKEE